MKRLTDRQRNTMRRQYVDAVRRGLIYQLSNAEHAQSLSLDAEPGDTAALVGALASAICVADEALANLQEAPEEDDVQAGLLTAEEWNRKTQQTMRELTEDQVRTLLDGGTIDVRPEV